MTRELKTSGDLRAIAADLAASAERLEFAAKVISELEPKGFPGLLSHGRDIKARTLQALFAWAVKMAGDAEIQAKAFHAGTPSKAEIDKRRAKKK